jgi:hypothetical protein
MLAKTNKEGWVFQYKENSIRNLPKQPVGTGIRQIKGSLDWGHLF